MSCVGRSQVTAEAEPSQLPGGEQSHTRADTCLTSQLWRRQTAIFSFGIQPQCKFQSFGDSQNLVQHSRLNKSIFRRTCFPLKFQKYSSNLYHLGIYFGKKSPRENFSL